MPSVRTPHPPPRPSRWLTALLVFALLGAQALGQAHRALHGPPGLSAGEREASAAAASFGHERQGDECRLFDQLLLADLAFAGVPLAQEPPCTVATPPRAAMAPGGIAEPAYRARAPPTRRA